METVLVRLTEEFKTQLVEMMDEWTTYNKEHPEEDMSPGAVFKGNYKNFEEYSQNLEIKEFANGLVPDSVFFALDTKRNIFVGAVNIRHFLNDWLEKYGGHIGLGIRPTERKKGYGTQVLSLALQECKKLGIKDVLVTCRKENIGSKKTILKNGGVKENELPLEQDIIERYWIKLKQAGGENRSE